MEKIKNIINPGSKKDDEVMYGSGQTQDPVPSEPAIRSSNEGSNLGDTHSSTDNPPTSTVNPPSSTAGSSEPLGQGGVGSIQQPSKQTNTSHMPGAFGEEGDSTSSVKSGIYGAPQAGSAVMRDSESQEPFDSTKTVPSKTTTDAPEALYSSNNTMVDNQPVGTTVNKDISQPTEPSHVRRDVALDVSPVGVGEDVAHDQDRSHVEGPSGTERSFPLRGNPDTAIGSEQKPSGFNADSWTHEHGKQGHGYKGDPCEGGEATEATPHFTSGPHATDTANKLDPNLGSDIGLPSSAPESAVGHHDDSQLLGSNDLVPGANTLGTAGYGNDRESPANLTSEEEKAMSSYGAAATNKLDPSVGSNLPKEQNSTVTSGPPSQTIPSSTAPADTSHGPVQVSSTTGYANPFPPSEQTSKAPSKEGANTVGEGHDYGRDVGLTGGGGVARYETTQKTDEGLHGARGATVLGDLPGDTNDSTYRSGDPATDLNHNEATDHHYGRDAGIAGAGLGVGAVAGHELSKTEMEKEQKERLEQLEKEQKQHQKQIEKDQKAAHKQQLKEEKKHEKALEKEEKKHEKAIEKEEKKQEKALEKEEKKREKALEKEEKKHEKEGEKKHHGGILGLFHREKPDEELKEDERLRQERLAGDSQHGVDSSTGVGLPEGENLDQVNKNDRNRLHKDPPPGYSQTQYAEEPKGGYASQVTGGTGTTALAQGEPVPRGSHLTGVGNKIDPNVAGRGDSLNSDVKTDSQGRIIEPRTGLPIDLSKGTGAGGTDSSPVPGFSSPGDTLQSSNSGTGGVGTTSSGTHPPGGEGSFGHLQDHPR
ncbi:MAG: hypothetical protein Q9167_000396 [Letrouitia subvulpina]